MGARDGDFETELTGFNIKQEPCLYETNKCLFQILIGTFVLFVAVAGCFLCIWIIYNIASGVMRLAGGQNIFILNVLLNDLAISVVGMVRGLGIIDRIFVGAPEESEPRMFCYLYTLIAQIFWCAPLAALLPLTIDRLIAIMFPLKHKIWITRYTSVLMILIQWTPSLGFTATEWFNFFMGHDTMRYQAEYHRCTFNSHDSAAIEAALFYFLPLQVLIILYIIMIVYIVRLQKNSRKLLRTSLLICSVGVVVAVPQVLLYTGVKLSYKLAQILTVALFYVTPIFDPLIYYCFNPKVKERIASSKVGRATRRMSQMVLASIVTVPEEIPLRRISSTREI